MLAGLCGLLHVALKWISQDTIKDCEETLRAFRTAARQEDALPELRKDPITGRWVIISTDRAKRPSDFVRESVRIEGKGFCPFCLGNETKTPPEVLAYGRNGGGPNTPGWTVRVV